MLNNQTFISVQDLPQLNNTGWSDADTALPSDMKSDSTGIADLAEKISSWVSLAKFANSSSQYLFPHSELWTSAKHLTGDRAVIDIPAALECPNSAYTFFTDFRYQPHMIIVSGGAATGLCTGRNYYSSTLQMRSGVDALWASLRSSIERWSRLPIDWDGANGVPPTKASVEHARRFVSQIRALNIKIPKGYISADGEIGFRWNCGEKFASAAFLHDGYFVGYIDQFSDRAVIEVDVLADLFTDRVAFFEGLANFQ